MKQRAVQAEKYEKEIPNYDKRFVIKAGLTALSHVYGRYSTDIVDRTHCNLLTDIRIMLLTSRALLLKDAAEGVHTADHREAAKNKITQQPARLPEAGAAFLQLPALENHGILWDLAQITVENNLQIWYSIQRLINSDPFQGTKLHIFVKWWTSPFPKVTKF